MHIVTNRSALRDTVGEYRQQKRRIGFVPTMGNLHAGHLRLIEQALDECDVVVVSIFVNPMQFGKNEDLDTYPRTPDEDIAALEALRVDVLYLPDVSDVYPGGLEMQTRVEVPVLSDMLCGLSRPVFFTGVATVVNRLFNLVQPDVAYFGRKDYQQLMIIRKMVEDLAMPVEIRGVDTVREADGLAMSSRNNYLSSEQRKIAARLYQVLCEAVEACSNHKESRADIEQATIAKLTGYGFDPDYVEIRRSLDLGVAGDDDRELIILAAAWLDGTRLIDNLSFTLSD